ncbi:MAG: hypothetical protein AB7G62_03185 [Magnetospirillum sp.]
MRASPTLLLLATLVVTGCAEEPFAQREISTALDKPINSVTKSGQVTVCYSDSSPWTEVEAIAADACGEYGYLASFTYSRRYQCRVTAPHEALFNCYHPEMTNAQGQLINPSDEKTVAEWQKRTGKMKPKPRAALSAEQQQTLPAILPAGPTAQTSGTSPANPASPDLGAPTPPGAQPAPYRPLNPADIAGKPEMAPAPLLAEPPPQVPLYPSGSSYTLQPESWGQQFDK